MRVIITWNMQGGGSANKWESIFNFAYGANYGYLNLAGSALCLQECTVPPLAWGGNIILSDQNDDSQQRATVRQVSLAGIGPTARTFYIAYREWTKKTGGNRRCSLAIVTTERPDAVYSIVSVGKTYRPVLAVRFGTLLIASTHIIATGGQTSAYDAFDLIGGLMAERDEMNARSIILAGDFNCSVQRLGQTITADTTGEYATVQVTAGGAATHQSNYILDYLVTVGLGQTAQQHIASPAPQSPLFTFSNQGGLSDHIPQIFRIG